MDLLICPRLLEFMLFDWLGVASGDAERRGTYSASLDLSLVIATDKFLPHHREADIKEPVLEDGQVRMLPAAKDALGAVREAGLFGATFPESLGGFELPQTVGLAMSAIFSSACISTWGFPMLTAANARLISAFGTPAQIDMFARPEIEGRWFGTMCLSEPQAGSSLADVHTRAVQEGEDDLGPRYRLTGNKMWISGGDQDASENIVHLVLARAQADDGSLPAGSKGLSLFIVPKWLPDGTANDVAVAGLNHKLGFRGIPNCLLNFGERGGAVGWIVGEEGQGLAQMFTMMNEARIGVGAGAAALAYRGFRHALRYSGERRQGRPIGISNGEPVPIIRHPDVRRMLLQQKAYAEAGLAICLYCANLIDQGGEHSDELLSVLTPVAKSWPAEFGLIANDLAIQVHGGYGYTRDFDVELLWRDNRLNPIHEGTTGIQAVDLLGRKLLRSDGAGLAELVRRVRATAGNAVQYCGLAARGRALGELWDEIQELLVVLAAREPSRSLDDATSFLRAFGHGVAAWIWLDQALAAARLGDTNGGVEFACRYFFEEEVPLASAWIAILRGERGAFVEIPEEAFG